MALKSRLGPLELTIMKLMWKLQKSTVHNLHKELSKQKKIALTTVSTTMNRLLKKGLLSREISTGKGGLFYIYSVKTTKEGFEEKESKNIAKQIIKSFGSSASFKIIEEISKNYSKEDLDRLTEELEKIKQTKSLNKDK